MADDCSMYYEKCQKQCLPILCKYLNSSSDGASMRKEMKDPTLPSSYKPISLPNTDVKIFAKILPERLKPSLPKDLRGWVSCWDVSVKQMV